MTIQELIDQLEEQIARGYPADTIVYYPCDGEYVEVDSSEYVGISNEFGNRSPGMILS